MEVARGSGELEKSSSPRWRDGERRKRDEEEEHERLKEISEQKTDGWYARHTESAK